MGFAHAGGLIIGDQLQTEKLQIIFGSIELALGTSSKISQIAIRNR